ncbi:MAG: hypothetical protein ACNA8W_09905, partial [Bradymonadaceae bacterium]
MYGALALMVTVLAACGGKEVAADKCEGIVCIPGVCDSASGSCVNAEVCEDPDDCLDGYECRDNACQPTFTCEEDDECERGVCSDGVCINPSQCNITAECIGGYYCSGEGVCQRDQCTDTSCSRG